MSAFAILDEAWSKPAGDCHGDEGQKKILADLEKRQDERQVALDHAAQNTDDEKLFEHFFDALGGGVYNNGLRTAMKDILETREGDDVTLDPRFCRAVRELAISFYKGAV